MRAKRPHDKSQLHLRQGLFNKGPQRAAQDALMRNVFGDAGDGDETLWWTTAYFDDAERCVASIEARVLPLIGDDRPFVVTGLRRIAVDPEFRGQGLMRDLMDIAILWGAKQSTHTTLLFTSLPELYLSFGFATVPQFAFVGVPPEPLHLEPCRPLNFERREDRSLLDNLLARRTPVSSQVAMNGAHDLVLGNLLPDEDAIIAYSKSLDAILVYEQDGDVVTLVDVIAGTIPSARAIVGSLPCPVREFRTLFPPDRIGWDGKPQPENTGLMCRGPLPAAMTRPFMLPPTAEF